MGLGHSFINSFWLYPVLFATGFAAGFVDSIAGGGGVITLPVLLSMGMPAQLALGTNKLQASFGSASATFHYWRSGLVKLSSCVEGILFTAFGAAAGTLSVQHIDSGLLKRIIPIVLLVIVAYLLFRPQLGETERKPRMTERWFYLVAGLVLGFYDGFFGPGVGSFWSMAFMLGLGFSLVVATGYTKVMNFTSNVVSFGIFAWGGQIDCAAGLVMGAGQLLGARLGSRLVVVKGARFIRPVFIAMVVAVTAKLIHDSWK